VAVHGDYHDDFSTIPVDVNGQMEFITDCWWGATLRWRENPGEPGREWRGHIIARIGNIETTRAWDADGDGYDEYVPNTPLRPFVVYTLERDAQGRGTGRFTAHCLKFHGRANDQQGHGLGFGNGHGDFIFQDGWLEAPPNPYEDEWIWHPEFTLPAGSDVPIVVAELNPGRKVRTYRRKRAWIRPLMVGAAARNSRRRIWTEHPIDPYSSQYHDLQWIDIDGDGQCELITGKRLRSHPHHEPGVNDQAAETSSNGPAKTLPSKSEISVPSEADTDWESPSVSPISPAMGAWT